MPAEIFSDLRREEDRRRISCGVSPNNSKTAGVGHCHTFQKVTRKQQNFRKRILSGSLGQMFVLTLRQMPMSALKPRFPPGECAFGNAHFLAKHKSAALSTSLFSSQPKFYSSPPESYPGTFAPTLGTASSISASTTTKTTSTDSMRVSSVQKQHSQQLHPNRSFHETTSKSSVPSTSTSTAQAEKQQQTLALSPWHSPHFQILFSLDLPEGQCIGLDLKSYPENHPDSLCPASVQNNPDHWIHSLLHSDEVQYGMDLATQPTRNTFFIGRLAMRTALSITADTNAKHKMEQDHDGTIPIEARHHLHHYHHLHSHSITNNHNGKPLSILMGRTEEQQQQQDICPFLPPVQSCDSSILKDEHGRPTVPPGFLGSISHKRMTGVALVSSYNDHGDVPPTRGIGVDLEQTFTRRKNISKRILTDRELQQLGQIEGVTRDEEVLLRFSLKECVYKAMHPIICQHVGFQEAEITPKSDGTALVSLNLKSGAHERFASVSAHWRRVHGDFFLSSSSVTIKES